MDETRTEVCDYDCQHSSLGRRGLECDKGLQVGIGRPCRVYELEQPQDPVAQRQVGGDHYLKAEVQPRDVMRAIEHLLRRKQTAVLYPHLYSVIKRVLRDKPGADNDIEKARHELALIVEEASR